MMGFNTAIDMRSAKRWLLTLGLSIAFAILLSAFGDSTTSTPVPVPEPPAESSLESTASPTPLPEPPTSVAESTVATTAVTTPQPLPEEPCAQSPETCQQRDISNFNPIRGETSGFGGAGYVVSQDEPTVEEILEKGLRLSEASPVHIAFRGAASMEFFPLRLARRRQNRRSKEKGPCRLWLGIAERTTPLPPAAEIENLFSTYLGALGAAISFFQSFLGFARGGLVR